MRETQAVWNQRISRAYLDAFDETSAPYISSPKLLLTRDDTERGAPTLVDKYRLVEWHLAEGLDGRTDNDGVCCRGLANPRKKYLSQRVSQAAFARKTGLGTLGSARWAAPTTLWSMSRLSGSSSVRMVHGLPNMRGTEYTYFWTFTVHASLKLTHTYVTN